MNNIKIKPCPFCGSTKIGISVKRKASYSYNNHHACCYCKDCNTYGPRLLINDTKDGVRDMGWINENNLPEELVIKTVKLWNNRK